MPTPIEYRHSRRRRITSPRPTMDDVAAAAGVSRATVSRALSGDEQCVSAATRAAIRQAVARTGYVVNQYARSLARQRSQAVAFVVCEPPQRLVHNLGFNVLLSACSEEATTQGLDLSLLLAQDPPRRQRVREQLSSGQLAGALVMSFSTGAPLIRDVLDQRVPVVAYGTPEGGPPGLAYVATDDRSGARQVVRHLRERGRHTIATIAGPLHTQCGKQRLAGWRDLVGAANRLVAYGDYSCAGGQAAMRCLLERAPHLDAVFAASEVMAAGAVTALRRAGRRVPEDVAVAGFGDSAVATTVEPPLTTVRQPLTRAGTELVRLLRELIDGRAPAGIVLPTELVVRDSA